jgi:hypothetical protein
MAIHPDLHYLLANHEVLPMQHLHSAVAKPACHGHAAVPNSDMADSMGEGLHSWVAPDLHFQSPGD